MPSTGWASDQSDGGDVQMAVYRQNRRRRRMTPGSSSRAMVVISWKVSERALTGERMWAGRSTAGRG